MRADERARPRGLFARHQLTLLRDGQRDQHAPAYGLAVQQLAVLGHGLDGVADGVPQVEDHAQAAFALVEPDDLGLDRDGSGYNLFE